nr:CCR4-NOT transcription complex subunit 10-like isoform X1 [Ipomoea batatas]
MWLERGSGGTIVIEDGLSRIRQENSVGREDLAFGDRQPIPSMSLARNKINWVELYHPRLQATTLCQVVFSQGTCCSNVRVGIGDPLRALSAARYLLKLPGCSRIYMFLGNLIAAEALCMLSRPKEAVEHLSRGTGDSFANLAAVSAVQGSLELAKEFAVQALSIMPKRPQAILTAVYVDLLRGNTQEALTKLKLCSSVRFLPTTLR